MQDSKIIKNHQKWHVDGCASREALSGGGLLTVKPVLSNLAVLLQ